MPSRTRSDSKTIEAAGNYTAGDVLSESDTNGAGTAWSWDGLGPSGQTFFITGGVLVGDNQSRLVTHRLHLFSNNPSNSELDDNAALNIVSADKSLYQGYIDFPATTDEGTAVTSQRSGLAHAVKTASGTLYGILEDLDGETDESAGETIEITLHAWWG